MNAEAQKVYETLLTEISEKRFSAAERIPTEMELAERFGTNRMNAHHAVKRLEADGIVERKRRHGTFIRKDLSPEILTDLRIRIAGTVHIFLGRKLAASHYHWNEATTTTLEAILAENGLTAFYHETPADRAGLEQTLLRASPADVRGLVYFPGLGDVELLSDNMDMLVDYGDRLFLFDYGLSLEGCPFHTLSLDQFGEGLAAASYLLGKGYRSILFAMSQGNKDALWVTKRLAGLRRGARSSTEGPAEVEALTVDSATDFLGRIRPGSTDPNRRIAVVAQNDCFAAELIEFGEKAGLKAGVDYAMLSFDDDPQCRKYNLTTLAPPVDRIGGILARMIVEQHWPLGEDGVRLSVKVSSRIVERSTCP